MRKVYIAIVDKKPVVYGSKGRLLQALEEMKLPFVPEIHECDVQRGTYNKRKEVDSDAGRVSH